MEVLPLSSALRLRFLACSGAVEGLRPRVAERIAAVRASADPERVPCGLVYGERGQPMEKPANDAFYAAARGEKEIWEVPGSKHMGGIEAQPLEYERRIVDFFDRTLLGKR